MAPKPDELLEVLNESVERLRRLVVTGDDERLRARAYPSEWSIADVLSHVGSGAVIMLSRLDADLAGTTLADDYAQPIWAEWNAKAPHAQMVDALAADRALVDGVAALTDDERANFSFSMGPMQLDLSGFLGMRLNEHVLHTWDIEIVLDPSARLQPSAVPLVVDNLSLIARFAGRPTKALHDLHVHTTDPARDFTLSLGAEAVALEPTSAVAAGAEPDLELPAEGLVRLVYGRLDPDHTPPVRGTADLDELRRAFPGV